MISYAKRKCGSQRVIVPLLLSFSLSVSLSVPLLFRSFLLSFLRSFPFCFDHFFLPSLLLTFPPRFPLSFVVSFLLFLLASLPLCFLASLPNHRVPSFPPCFNPSLIFLSIFRLYRPFLQAVKVLLSPILLLFLNQTYQPISVITVALSLEFNISLFRLLSIASTHIFTVTFKKTTKLNSILIYSKKVIITNPTTVSLTDQKTLTS